MTGTITQEDWGKVVAEIIGTFFFFFIGFGSILITSSSHASKSIPSPPNPHSASRTS